MIRIIKRYESRKLYDTEESRYVSLEDIALWVREGQEVRVIDNATSADVSAQVLTQIILDEGKKGTSFLPTELLHELVRAGEKALNSGVEQFQGRVGRIVQSSIDRLAPVRRAREEMGQLRDRLSQLERALDDLDQVDESAAAEDGVAAEDKPSPRRRRTKATAPKAEAEGSETAAAPKEANRSRAAGSKSTPAKTPRSKTAATKTAAAKTADAKTAASKSAGTKKATPAKKTAAAKTTTAKSAAAKKTTTGKTTTAKTTTAKTAAAKKTTTAKKTTRRAVAKTETAAAEG